MEKIWVPLRAHLHLCMKPTSNTAVDLFSALQGSDLKQRNAALKQLYLNPVVNAKVREWVKSYALRDKEPDDVLQEAIILLDDLVRNGRFRGESKVETFLLGICKNLIRDGSKKVDRIFFKDEVTDNDFRDEDAVADSLIAAELSALELQRDAHLMEAMRQLSTVCQEALRLYYLENKSMRELADARGLANPEQAKKNVHRCRESLREIITGNPFFKNF